MLKKAAEVGHGATIVLIGPNDIEAVSESVQTRFSFEQVFGLKRLLEHVLRKEGDIRYKPAYNRLVVERVESISQLAAVDGALILNSELDVITWGATLRAASWTRKVLIGPDGRGVCTGERFERERFGTRHNSAIDFAGSHPGSVVFVASQDGPIRAFLRTDDETVSVWPDCGVSMFLDGE